mmetsp:Transcript_14012/g.15394  ORF Transcript_14012/g.15394 Transcript_14012/m.15394 type:complete len:228 (+) Transcript_14012:73-756(+)|eukprot:CAMPEP_0195290982 /NCGR_PEP_ID=MMETSP0707-20130614/6855_1 /TAXON_ID=33640 /ORGANISM="Asterionellopsis glacialis, Strain CCMP134" /LENGTH=227 /DNA_ID=CAMNT_0040351193 /DNA_START=74 /DNA_END=757 /DNA_ORIENTATION=+
MDIDLTLDLLAPMEDSMDIAEMHTIDIEDATLGDLMPEPFEITNENDGSSENELSSSSLSMHDDDIIAFYQDEEADHMNDKIEEHGVGNAATTDYSDSKYPQQESGNSSTIKTLSASRFKPEFAPSPQPYKKRAIPNESIPVGLPLNNPSSNDDLIQRETYKRALSKLQVSMSRSEESILVQHRRLAEAARKRRVNGFFSGSQSTLTTGLEQSRNMLKTYLQQMDKL